jgi:tRNA G18 (ribose-2'-O)-methylase SpoU
MPFVRIDEAADVRLAAFHRMADADLMRQDGLFVAEGRLVVRRVIEDRRFPLRSLLLDEANRRALEDVLAGVPPDVPIFVCDTRDFAGITGFNLHRGCLALVERPEPLAPCAILLRAQTLVVLEGVTNADNVGGVFRNAAAFGVDGVLLSPTCCDPLYRKAIRTSMGAALRVPFARIEDWPSGLSDVRGAGFTIAALSPRVPSQTLDTFVESEKLSRVALMVGSEGGGLSEGAEAAADVRVRIPTHDAVDSLNLAVATGIALARLFPHST